jgi:hypothetical protein
MFSDPLSASAENQGQQQLPAIDYTAWDYPAIKRMLYRIARNMFGDKYNNFVESDFGVVALEYLAAHADSVSFKTDYAVNEAIFLTAALPKNIKRHARSRGYRPRPRMPAYYDMAVTVPQAYSVDIIIQSGFLIQNNVGIDGNIIAFQVYVADENGNPIEDEDIILPAGSTSNTNIVGIEGETRAVQIEGTGQPFQTISLSEQDVLPNSIRVFVDNTRWSEVETLYNQGPKQVYRVDVNDRDDRYFVVGGDGSSGLAFPEGSRVEVVYRVGGGDRGNVPSGFINITETIAVPVHGISAPITFLNRSRGRGGDNGETIDEIRANVPFFLKRQDRLTSLEDYASFATTYFDEGSGRVAKARAYLRHAGCSANIIDIFIVEYINKTTIARPSDKLIESLSKAIEVKKMATHSICIKPGRIVETSVRVFANFPRSYSVRKAEMESLVNAAIEFFFSLETWTFGRPLRPTDATKFILSGTPATDVLVDFELDPGFDMNHDGSYTSAHNELIRSRSPEINISFTGDQF